MAEVKKVKNLRFALPNRVGQLAAVCEPIAQAKVNIEALWARESGETAEFMLATDSNAKTKRALASLGVEIQEQEVVCLELQNRVGTLAEAARRLAEAGVNIKSMWGTAFSGKTAACVLLTSDDRKAISVLGKKVRTSRAK